MDTKWDEMGLKDELLRGIYSYGFENPSIIQQQAIAPMIARRNLIGQAQSGNGKTGAFTIGTLQLVDVTIPKTQALVLAPTHELAKQISGVMSKLGQFMEGLRVKTLIGGTVFRDDVYEVTHNPPHVIVGCTGKVLSMLQKQYIIGGHLRLIVLDEADEMLSDGFGAQIREMFHFFDPAVQVTLFSATLPEEMMKLIEEFVHNPVRIMVKANEQSLKCISQYYVAVFSDAQKYETLKKLFSAISVSKCIVYCNTVKRVIDLFEYMEHDGFSVCHIHSMMNKDERAAVFDFFVKGDARVLISSDITARGIDIQQVSTVINYDVPRNISNYLHRIGRSGRWGRKGCAINFVTRQDVGDLRRVESFYSTEIVELPANFNGI